MTTAVSYLAYGLIVACTLLCVAVVVWHHVSEAWRDLKTRLYVVDDRAVRRIGGGTP